jgi:hypothetical protein
MADWDNLVRMAWLTVGAMIAGGFVLGVVVGWLARGRKDNGILTKYREMLENNSVAVRRENHICEAQARYRTPEGWGLQ